MLFNALIFSKLIINFTFTGSRRNTGMLLLYEER